MGIASGRGGVGVLVVTVVMRLVCVHGLTGADVLKLVRAGSAIGRLLGYFVGDAWWAVSVDDRGHGRGCMRTSTYCRRRSLQLDGLCSSSQLQLTPNPILDGIHTASCSFTVSSSFGSGSGLLKTWDPPISKKA